MATRIKNKIPRNLGLSNRFVFDITFAVVDEVFSKGKKIATTSDSIVSLNKYLDEDSDVDYAEWAKEIFGLKRKPSGYYISLRIYSVSRMNDEMLKLELTYPERYRPTLSDERNDMSLLIKTNRSEQEWMPKLRENLKKYFNSQQQWKAPVPVLIQYASCGFYTDPKDKEKFEDHFQHEPSKDQNYHKVLANIPARINQSLDAEAIFRKLATQVNEHARSPVLSFSILFDLWIDFMVATFLLKHSKSRTKECSQMLNRNIKTFNLMKPSPQKDFYLRHCYDFLIELEQKRILKKCPNCNLAFKYSEQNCCSFGCEKKLKFKNYYQTKRKEILPAKREYMRFNRKDNPSYIEKEKEYRKKKRRSIRSKYSGPGKLDQKPGLS